MSKGEMFRGLWVALVTPFRGGAVDEAALRGLVRHVLRGGVQGLVPVGSTGEAATQSEAERMRVLEIVLEEAAGKVPVMPGTGTNCTETSVALTRAAQRAGAQAALVVTPYYNKPTPEGQIAHFEAVARVGLPILMYNIPGRTGVNMTVETMLHLGRLPEIAGVKESSGSLDTVSELVGGAAERGLEFAVMSGDDSLALPSLAVGATGLISVVANAAPRETREILAHFQAGRTAEAARAHARLLPLIKALFAETNPAPVKALLARLGMMQNELRLPLVPVRPATEKRLQEVWERLGLAAPAAAGAGS
ncbi:MAG TPA: 4-hydroxy-tetrahydrodipicolinate synthase [Candidatus Saccharimonadales bacterium]|nr:4-hydroxy-tetrahydrodipicolinate synthase [Candidatus Saccharimonadales bacterium]